VLALSGCPKGGLPVDLSGFTPKVRYQRMNVDDIDFREVDTTFVFRIDNPNPVDLSVASFTYQLDLAGTRLIGGEGEDGLRLEANEATPFRLPVTVAFADVLQIARDARGEDELPFRISGRFGFQTPLGVVRVPFEEEGRFPVVRPPRFRVAGARVAELRPLQNRAVLEVDVGVTQQGGAPLSIDAFDYDLTLAGSRVAEGVVASLATVPAGTEQVVTLPVELNLANLGATVVRAITDRDRVDVGLAADMRVGTPFGPIPLRIDERGAVQLR
jgi:LEA14-like dessication related protein